MSKIHPTAIIEDGAVIGKNVTVGAYSYIAKDVTIGDNTTIGSHTLIEDIQLSVKKTRYSHMQ